MTTAGPIKRLQSDLPAGTEIGRYRVEEPVGRGGMGTVYRAFDKTTNRNVALKLLAEGIPASLRDRFLAECEAEANIRHENVMPVYDRGWLTDERPYFVMELLYEPITLTELMDEINAGTLGSHHPRLRAWNDPRRLIADVVLPVIEGIHVANEEYGVQHRDLKPDNVLIDIRTRRAYLIDFGICRGMDDEKDRGRIVGTPRFLSPEQAAAQMHRRTDIWGLGAILRYVITGEPPLAGTSPFTRAEVRKRIEALREAEATARAAGEEAKARGYAGRREQLEDPTLRVQEDLLRDAVDGVYLALPEGMSPGLAAIIQKAMAKDGDARYATAGEMARDVRAWIQGSGVQALQEASSSGAAMDFARRLLNRNVMRGAGALTALLIGLLLGTGLFSTTPPPADHRAADRREDDERLRRAWAEATADDAPLHDAGFGLAPLHWLLLRRRDALAERRRSDPADETDLSPAERGPGGPADPAWLHRVVVKGWRPPGYEVHDLTDLSPRPRSGFAGAVGALWPGAYHVRSKQAAGLELLISVPPTIGEGFHASDGMERTLRLGAPGTDVPAGMTWIPAGTSEPGGDAIVKPFLAARDLVTHERYSEWLDDLPAAERGERVPRTGFVRDERDPQRWLVAQGLANEPVLGVRPRDAAAYAKWRGDIDGIVLALPTDLQWRRMAAADRMADPGAAHVFPWRSAPSWKRRLRRGEPAAVSPGAATVRRMSPHGVRRMFAGPGEIARTNDRAGFVAKARGGMIPLPSAAARATDLAPDAADHGLGFRLVYEP